MLVALFLFVALIFLAVEVGLMIYFERSMRTIVDISLEKSLRESFNVFAKDLREDLASSPLDEGISKGISTGMAIAAEKLWDAQKEVDFTTVVVGNHETATIPGGGKAVSGDEGTSIAGDWGLAISGEKGYSIAGDFGFSQTGIGGEASAGNGGRIRILWKTAPEIMTAYDKSPPGIYVEGDVGFGQLRSRTLYVCSEEGELVVKKKAQERVLSCSHHSTVLAGEASGIECEEDLEIEMTPPTLEDLAKEIVERENA